MRANFFLNQLREFVEYYCKEERAFVQLIVCYNHS